VENDQVDSMKKSSPDANVSALLGHGLTAKIGVGYRF
jgi:hypothetical protein